jgi:hypothetical protein
VRPQGNSTMKTSQQISPEEIRDYLGKGWLTHDGMWFYNTFRAVGIEQANAINLAAIRSMAPLEMQRTRKILAMENRGVESMEELFIYLKRALELVLPASVLKKFSVSVPAPDRIQWSWDDGECFAYKGVKQIGCIDRYACGVIYRIDCWLDMLGIEHRIDPPVGNCLMHEKGFCRGDIIVNLGNRTC